jgi:alkanesulfonate monooxygenase SsuD/methylene tetrahydromethanopterin reductase-like flavin-dependent oxidoreductase (luciferase family)
MPPAPLGRFPDTTRPMGIGLMLPTSDERGPDGAPRFQELVEIVQTAEELGFDSVWAPDHFVYRYPGIDEVFGVWEAWTLLAGLAAKTTRLTLSVFVTGLVFRNPGVVAKMAEAHDEISGGRFILGLGAGSRKPDFDFLGLPFDHRASRSEEAVAIISALLREGQADIQGRFFEATNAHNQPRGPRGTEGGPPILIGTRGPRMLRLTARYADAWNGDWHRATATLIPLLAEVDAACADAGRDPATLVRTAGSNFALPGNYDARPNPITGSVKEMADAILSFQALGLRHYVVGLDPVTPRSLEQFARVIELVDRNGTT